MAAGDRSLDAFHSLIPYHILTYKHSYISTAFVRSSTWLYLLFLASCSPSGHRE